jgi:hypothetical protein
LGRWIIDAIDIGPHKAILFPEPVNKKLDRFMAFSEPSEHVVEIAVIDAKLALQMFLEIIDHHSFGGLLHFLEDLIQIVIMLCFFAVVCVVMGIVEVD